MDTEKFDLQEIKRVDQSFYVLTYICILFNCTAGIDIYLFL